MAVNYAEDRILNDIVTRTLGVSAPKRILLFGSAASDTMHASSDYDILIIVADGTHRRRTTNAISKAMSDLRFAKDVVVVTESDVKEHGDNPSLVLYPALTFGRELYHD